MSIFYLFFRSLFLNAHIIRYARKKERIEWWSPGQSSWTFTKGERGGGTGKCRKEGRKEGRNATNVPGSIIIINETLTYLLIHTSETKMRELHHVGVHLLHQRAGRYDWYLGWGELVCVHSSILTSVGFFLKSSIRCGGVHLSIYLNGGLPFWVARFR